MAFSRYRSRGIGGLRGQFQQPQQMQQQGMQGFNLSGPRPLGPAQMQQMGAVAGDYGQRGRDAQMQALQRFNPKMRSDHRIQGFQPPQQGMPQQGMPQQMGIDHAAYMASQNRPDTRPPWQIAQQQAQSQQIRAFQAENPGQQFNPQQAAYGKDPMIAARRGFQPPQPDPLLGQGALQQHMQRMGSLPFRPRPLEEPRSTHQPPAHPQGASGMAGYAQRPSPPPPSFANAPRPPQQLVGAPSRPEVQRGGLGRVPEWMEGSGGMVQDQLRQQPVQTPPTAPNQAAGGAGGPPTSWKMSIEPMARGGMIPGYHSGGSVPSHEHGEGAGQHSELSVYWSCADGRYNLDISFGRT